MKRITVILLTLVMMASLAACGESSSENEVTTKEVETTTEAESTQEITISETSTEEITTDEEIVLETAETEPDNGSDTLIVYFSWSGNTRKIAESIQEKTGADIFEIIPETAYPDDYDVVIDIASEEQGDDVRPAIADTIYNIDQYDTIIVGFPNWWADMPMILYTFFDEYDLSGKTIAPFATSASSGLSDTVNSIKREEPNATVVNGLSIRERNLNSSDTDIVNWLETIN